ncbi:MAG: hypothetical protein Q7U16_20355 [Agitococcus sp.]|nr:hypothetical protein [Agitococcus sp.]
MQWQEIIEFLGGASLFAAVIAYLGKTAVDAFVSGRVEAFKAELQRLTTEHSVRFQRLHSERAEVIKDFYAKLTSLDELLASTLAPFQSAADKPLVEKVQALSVQFNETREYFLPRRVFFEESTCLLVDKVLDLARGIFFNITTLEVDPQHLQYKYDRSVLKDRHEFWENARVVHKNEFVALKHALEDEFRKQLGIGA